MPSQVLIYLGPVRCGKTREMLGQYRDALRQAGPPGLSLSKSPIDRTLWLAPTSRGAAAIRQQLVADGLTACLSPGIMTFDQLTGLILASSERSRTAAGISPAARRELLRRVLKTIVGRGELSHFRDAARRAGFIDLVANHIRELNEHGIDPAAYAKAGAGHDRAAEHRELALIFAEYERQLDSHALCDADGRHNAARALLAADACPRLRNLQLVVVDGFTDFTRTQHELLRLLAHRAQQLLITLPSDHSPPADRRTDHFSDQLTTQSITSGRPDLFAKTISTLAELKHFHPKLEIRALPPRPIAWPALDHLAQHLFRNPRQVPPLPAAAAESLNRFEIIEAAGSHDEIIQIARHIKRRLLREKGTVPFFRGTSSSKEDASSGKTGQSPARPGDIVVAFRSLTDAAPRIREVFTNFGIPYSLETGLPLATAAVLRTILSLLRLAEEDWPFRRVVSVLVNNTLTAIADDARRAADWLVRDLQIATGREALLTRVEQLAAVDDAANDLSEHAQRRVAEAKLALPVLQSLAAAFDELPNKANPLEWIAALERLSAQLGLEPISCGTPRASSDGRGDDENGHALRQELRDVPPINADPTAWQTITTHFAALNRLDIALGESPRPLTRHELLHWLIDLAGHESLPRPYDDAGRVRVLSAATARTIAARHLYLAGMSEQTFPSPERAGLLATNADYRYFAGVSDQEYAAACPLAVNHQQEEMLLFYEVLTRAEESLTISYPALDDKAQVLPPSPYVTEILRTLGDAADQVKRTGPHLSPVPSVDEPPFDLTDWRIRAISQAVGKERDLRLLAGIFQSDPLSLRERAGVRDLAAALEAGLRITHARQRRDDFGPAEGLLISPAVAARLAERFGPQHLWSPSQWEHYAACPYQFYLQSVLKLEPLGDLALETDYRRRGSLLHHVLATFHRQFGASPAESWSALQGDEARFIAEMNRTLQAAIDAMPRTGIDAALVELDRRQIEKWTGQYHGQHEKYDSAWTDFDEPPRPTYFELRFGPRRPGDDSPEDPRSTDKVFALDIGGETILITGRIDRIDVGRAGDRIVFNVIDYKSGRRPTLSSDKLESGERLQPAVYVMAAEMLVFGPNKATPQWAGYWSMQNGVNTDAKYSLQCSVDGTVTKDWKELRPTIEQRIGQFVADIREGKFPVASRDPDCTSRCEFNTVCRIAQIRSLGKTWTPESGNP